MWHFLSFSRNSKLKSIADLFSEILDIALKWFEVHNCLLTKMFGQLLARIVLTGYIQVCTHVQTFTLMHINIGCFVTLVKFHISVF